jgi:uncharacterized protein
VESQPRITDVPDPDRPGYGRYVASIDDHAAGYIDYRRSPGRILLVHTEVDPAFEGRGVGGALARHALDTASTAGTRVLPACPFIRSWLERHPEYADILLSGPRSSD